MALSTRIVATAIWGDVDLDLVEFKNKGKYGRTTTSYTVMAKCADGVNIPIQHDFDPNDFKDFCKDNGYIITNHYDPNEEALEDESSAEEAGENAGD